MNLKKTSKSQQAVSGGLQDTFSEFPQNQDLFVADLFIREQLDLSETEKDLYLVPSL